MFEYIKNNLLKETVQKGYHLCHKDDNFSAFVNFINALDIPASISMRIIMEVLRNNGPKMEGLERGLRTLLGNAGAKEYRTVKLTAGDEGITELKFGEPKPIKTELVISSPGSTGKLECYSILGRTPASGISDGNPLIYALKRINNWRLASVDDFSILLDYYIAVCNSTFNGGLFADVDVLIPLPSSAKINAAMVNCITGRFKPEIITLDYLKKQSVESAYSQIDEMLIDVQWMGRLYPELRHGTQEYDRKLRNVISDLENAKQRNTESNAERGISGNPFAIKYIPVEYRKLFNDYITGAFPDGILEGKNVLVVDDSIASGQSLRGFVEKYVVGQKPASVRALTLLSPLLK